MKKLIPLILLMMMSLQGFSQSVIDTTKIQLKKPIARLVFKWKNNSCFMDSVLINLIYYQTGISNKDSVIFNLNERVTDHLLWLSNSHNYCFIKRIIC